MKSGYTINRFFVKIKKFEYNFIKKYTNLHFLYEIYIYFS